MTDFQDLRTTMVDTQIRPSDVTKYPIIEAMLEVPREQFLPEAARGAAYSDAPVDLGGGRSVLEPRTFAKMLDALAIGGGDMVLDVGCGLGYSAAVIAHIAEFVVALEEDEALAGEAEERLAAQGVDNVAVISGSLAEGDAPHGPYDVIIVEGAVEQVPPALLEQVNEGGRIIAIFADGMSGAARMATKMNGHVDWRHVFSATAPVLPGFSREVEFAL